MKKLRYANILLRDFRTLKNGEVVNYNIGTTAHAPGTIVTLQKYLPEGIRIAVWADAPLSAPLADMMRKRFPEIRIVHGSLLDGKASNPELEEEINRSDIFLVSSGSGIAGSVANSLRGFRDLTGKPCGAYAIGWNSHAVELVDDLDFAWFRDSVSTEKAARSGTRCPLHGWAPDAVFDFDCIDPEGTAEFMTKYGLKPGGFICCIPGARHTPRWDFFNTPFDAEKAGFNAEMEERDHAPLREIICEAVRKYGLQVLICSEQIPEMNLAQRVLYERLPEDVKSRCVLPENFWAPELALGVYKHSLCVFGIEMHSPVMALGNGIPSAVFRHSGFGSKSMMWDDIGLGEWLLDIDAPNYPEQAPAIIRKILDSPEKAAQKVQAAKTKITIAAQAALERSFLLP